MTDLTTRLEAARELLVVEATPGDTARALHRFERKRRQRRRRRIAASGVASVAAVVAGIALWAPQDPTVEPAPVAEVAPTPREAPANRVVYFSDGSHATLVQPRTEIRVEASQDDLLELSLGAGEARFEVVPRASRVFRVRTADLRIEVLGTSFTVHAEPDGTSSVKVHEGRVAVFIGANRHELGRDMQLEYVGGRAIVEKTDGAPTDDVEAEKKTKKKRRRKARRAARREQPWKKLAKDGAFGEAFEALEESPSAPRGTEALMLAADVARLSGHPEEAARYLGLVVDRHPNHPRALVAAFTLGRLWQRELDDPRRAAEAYATARRLGPTGSLAEDALAHEAECWARAGDAARASERATEYVERYPRGRKIRSMRRLGKSGE